MFLLKKYINNNFETLNSEKQELIMKCLISSTTVNLHTCNFPMCCHGLIWQGIATLLVKADIRLIDINTFKFPFFIWKVFTFGSLGNNDITFPTLFYSMKTFLRDVRQERPSFVDKYSSHVIHRSYVKENCQRRTLSGNFTTLRFLDKSSWNAFNFCLCV